MMSYTAKINNIYVKSSMLGKTAENGDEPRIQPSKKLMADACRDGKMLLEVYYDASLDQATISVLMPSKTPTSRGSSVKFKVVKFWDLLKEGLESRVDG